MRRFFSAVLVVLALAGCAPQGTTPAAPPSATWDPSRTWVFAVGVLEWKQSDIFPGFPKEGRRDAEFIELLQSRGVSKDRIIFLKDQEATKRRIEEKFSKLLDKTEEGDTLIFYYAGHGVKDENGNTYFANYDATDDVAETAWPVDSVLTAINQKFNGSHTLLFADNCYSGALAPAFTQIVQKIGYASLTSSLSSQPSTGNWTFTESVIAGFRGDRTVDRDNDDVVTLAELAEHTEAEMAFVDGQRSSFVAFSPFPPSFKIATAGRGGSESYERVEVLWEGQWYRAKILDHQRAGDAPERFRIHYVGWGPEWDEWVSPDRVRPYAPVVFPRGKKVAVAWSPTLIFSRERATWYPATVIEGEHGLHLIHYDGYSDVWDEWVAPERVRPR